MRKRTFFVSFLMIAVLAAVLGINAWALSVPEAHTAPVATVTVDEGEAFFSSAAGAWQPVSVDTQVHSGDHVKTDARSQATINFYNGATTRLDENSEIAISAIGLDPDNFAHLSVDVSVVAGRVWSRVVKFLDTESSYRVETSSVVATVRGTAFVTDVRDREADMVQVADGTVQVAAVEHADESRPDGWQPVSAGDEAWAAKQVDRRKKEGMRLRPSQPNIADQAWIKKMMAADERYLQAVRQARNDQLQAAGALLPGSLRYPLRRFGEQVRLALTTSAAARRTLRLQYARRRFAEAVILARAGKQAAAGRSWKEYLSVLKSVWEEVKAPGLPRGAAVPEARKMLGHMLEVEQLVQPVDGAGDVPAYLSKDVFGEQATMRTMADTMRSTFPEIVGWKRPQAGAAPTPAAPETEATSSLETTIGPVEINTNVNTPPVNTNQNTNTPAAVVPKSLSITVVRTIMNAPDSQQLRAVLTMSDGTTQDVTNQAVWTLSGAAIGTISQGMLLTTDPGIGTVQAQVSGLTASATIRVLQPAQATLQSLTVSPAVTTVLAGNQASFQAIATWSDGTTQDVTNQAAWAIGDSKIGSVVGGLLRTTTTSYGQTTVNASFTDNGITKTGSATVTVTLG